MENVERFRQIYREMILLLESSRIPNRKWFGYKMAFTSKMSSFEIMYLETMKNSKELERVFKEEMAEGKILADRTSKAWNRTAACFEAYLNAFYSLLQIIAKITVCYYEREMSREHFGGYFGELIDFFKKKKNASIDPDFSAYLTKNLGWYEVLRNNRHMITHEGTAFLGFEKDGTILFLDYPKKGFDWDEQNKSNRELEGYLNQSFKDLFDFLDFYANHFRRNCNLERQA